MPARLRTALRNTVVASATAPLLLLGVPGTAAAAPGAGTTPGPTATASAASQPVAKVNAKKKKKRAAKIKRVLRVAKKQRGDRYEWGGTGPHRFDCSGLVYFSTHRAGFGKVPRTSSDQSRFMKRIKRKAMPAGDIVFFTGRGGVYHLGIVTGRKDGRRLVLHAPGSGERVRIDPIWTDDWFAGTLRR